VAAHKVLCVIKRTIVRSLAVCAARDDDCAGAVSQYRHLLFAV